MGQAVPSRLPRKTLNFVGFINWSWRKRDLAGVQDLVKELTSGLIQEIMGAELEVELVTVSMTTKISRRTMHGTVTTRRRSSAAKVTSSCLYPETATVNTNRKS